MRAEDLFEAMGALDEQLIALSEEDGRRARKAEKGRARQEADKRKAKRKKRAEIYRFAAVAMTAAAAVFIVLTARDLLGARSRGMSESAAVSSEYIREESAAEEAAQDTLAGGAAELQADPEALESDAGALSKYREAQDTDEAEEAAPAAEAAADRESAAQAAKKSGPDEAEENEAQKAAENAESGTAAAEPASETAAPGSAGEAAQPAEEAAEAGGKTAVDLLGENKGDYVKLEIISAKDRADGGETIVPEYTPEREETLTAALKGGRKMPVMLVRIGAPIYYVYLTDSKGNVDTVTFYELGYVGIDTFPGFVMELSDEAFEAVKEMFE